MKTAEIENEAKLLSNPIRQAFLDGDGDELQRQVFLVCKELVEERQKQGDTMKWVNIYRTGEDNRRYIGEEYETYEAALAGIDRRNQHLETVALVGGHNEG